MAIVKQGGIENFRSQGVMTTMGLRERRPPLCMKCGGRKDGLYTVNGNGQQICPDCASPKDRVVLTGCDPETCACGTDAPDDPAA